MEKASQRGKSVSGAFCRYGRQYRHGLSHNPAVHAFFNARGIWEGIRFLAWTQVIGIVAMFRLSAGVFNNGLLFSGSLGLHRTMDLTNRTSCIHAIFIDANDHFLQISKPANSTLC